MPLFCGCCPAWAEGCLSASCFFFHPFIHPSILFCSFLGLRLLPGVGGRSPARRGAWSERGRGPSTPPAPPYSPFCGNAKVVSVMRQYPARRVSRGRRRGPSRPFRPGDVRACCGAPSALRAHGIAFAPAPSLQQRQEAEGGALPEGCRSGKSAEGAVPGGREV